MKNERLYLRTGYTPRTLTDPRTLDEREADSIRWVLDQNSGNGTRAARILGIDCASRWRELKRMGLTDDNGGRGASLLRI